MVYGSFVWLDLDELSAVGLGSVPLRGMALRLILRWLVLFPADSLRIPGVPYRSRQKAASRSRATSALSSGDSGLCSPTRHDRHRAHASARSKREDSSEFRARRFFDRCHHTN